MWYVYILKSRNFPKHIYFGCTENLKQRFADHNSGKSAHTSKYLPWDLVWYAAFSDKQMAYDFEKYLKSHSGRAFATKRLLKREIK